MDIGSTVAAVSIERGTIFHSTIFEEIDHGKFFVVIGENGNDNFLSHNSFLNCSALTTIDKRKLSESIANGETTITGQMTNEDIAVVLRMVRESKLYSKIEKDTYFAE